MESKIWPAALGEALATVGETQGDINQMYSVFIKGLFYYDGYEIASNGIQWNPGNPTRLRKNTRHLQFCRYNPIVLLPFSKTEFL
jgi:hypothetical protein